MAERFGSKSIFIETSNRLWNWNGNGAQGWKVSNNNEEFFLPTRHFRQRGENASFAYRSCCKLCARMCSSPQGKPFHRRAEELAGERERERMSEREIGLMLVVEKKNGSIARFPHLFFYSTRDWLQEIWLS